MNKALTLLAALLIIFPGCSSAKNVSPEQKFKESYPQNTYESFTPTSLKGVYEVYDGKRVYYYLPEGDVVFYGGIVTKDGINLTRESHMQKVALKMSKLPLEKALKAGQGNTTVVKFTDPNCPYCRRGFEFFDHLKNEVTTYVFFFPLSADSERKIRHIFCAGNPVKAYEDVMSGKLDGNAELNLCDNQEVESIIQAHHGLASQIGVRATPLFYIRGQIVDGFDPPVIEKLLKE